jgi:G6PDH family F420-dependent oxidoreductase
MLEVGYTLSSEEFAPRDLIRHAKRAEDAGFTFALVSDHYHPWIDRQGHSPFVWSVLGGVAQATEHLRVGTGVTCPIIRIHPAIVAQAAATVGCMMPGRFFLGAGTGENLNEHVLGDRWPPADVRLEMLEEAVAIMRVLWQGGRQSYRGRYYTVENARVYDVPDPPVPVMIAAKGPKARELAARAGDGLIGTAPDRELIEEFEAAGGSGKPKFGQLHVCWGASEAEAARTALEWWPNTSLPGRLGVDLPLPSDFEAAAKLVTIDTVKDSVVCGPDAERHVEAIRRYADAGFDHVYVHQIGPDQEGFFRFYEQSVLPKLR